jgi:hypothetical protein
MKSESRPYGNSILIIGSMGSGKSTSFHKLVNHGFTAVDMDLADDKQVQKYLKALRHEAFALDPKSPEARKIWELHNAVFVPVTRTKFRTTTTFLPNCITLTHSPEFLLGNSDLAQDASGVRGVVILDVGYREFQRRLDSRDPGKWSKEFKQDHYAWFKRTVGDFVRRFHGTLPIVDLNALIKDALQKGGRKFEVDPVNEEDAAMLEEMKEYPYGYVTPDHAFKVLLMGIEWVIRMSGGGPLSLYDASPEISRRLKWLARQD